MGHPCGCPCVYQSFKNATARHFLWQTKFSGSQGENPIEHCLTNLTIPLLNLVAGYAIPLPPRRHGRPGTGEVP